MRAGSGKLSLEAACKAIDVAFASGRARKISSRSPLHGDPFPGLRGLDDEDHRQRQRRDQGLEDRLQPGCKLSDQGPGDPDGLCGDNGNRYRGVRGQPVDRVQ